MFDVYSDMLKKSVAWSTLGNHDGHSATSSTQSGPYYDIFSFPKAGEAGGTSSGTEAYYSFDYANIHFMVLESHQLYDDSTQMDWCLSDIQETNQDWIVNDTYPDRERNRLVYLYHVPTGRKIDLGKFYQPPGYDGYPMTSLRPGG